MHSYLIAADIGGTNSRFALYSSFHHFLKPLHIRKYLNSEYIKSNFTDVLKPFLSECFNEHDGPLKGMDPDTVEIIGCFACAGPSRNNSVMMTNINAGNFTVDGNSIEKSTEGLLRCVKRIKVINDFVAQGYGIISLNLEVDCSELIPGSIGKIDKNGPVCCVGAGTGLGECYLIKSNNDEYQCFASEGGHVDFAPRNQLEWELLQFIKDKHQQKNRASVERVVSGPGIADAYEFLAQNFPEQVQKDVHQKFLNAGDMQGRVVSENSKQGSLCERAMNIFAGAYGAEVGNVAVKFIPTGGLYIVGDMTQKNLDYIQDESSPFMEAYKDKGRLSPMLEEMIPLFIVNAEDLGLKGARACALQMTSHST